MRPGSLGRGWYVNRHRIHDALADGGLHSAADLAALIEREYRTAATVLTALRKAGHVEVVAVSVPGGAKRYWRETALGRAARMSRELEMCAAPSPRRKSPPKPTRRQKSQHTSYVTTRRQAERIKSGNVESQPGDYQQPTTEQAQYRSVRHAIEDRRAARELAAFLGD